MSHKNEQPPLTDSDVQERLQDANAVLEELSHYQEIAGSVDSRFERANEHRDLALHELPYGEELIRVREAAESVESAIEQLEQIEAGKISGAKALEAFDLATNDVEEARATLEDCKELPDDEPDEED